MIITVDLKGIDKALAVLRPEIAQKTLNRTLNDLIIRGSNSAKKKVRERYNIKAKQLNRYIKVRKASGNNLEARLSVMSRDASLFHFINKSSISSSITAKKRRGRRPVKIKVLKQGGTHALRHAFVMIGKSGNIGIFERVVGVKSSTGKDKIRRLNTTGPAKMFDKAGVPEMQKYVDENTGRIFKQNFNYYIGKVK
jgi:integrase